MEVQLPRFNDWRGGGLRLTFVHNPRKYGGEDRPLTHSLTTLPHTPRAPSQSPPPDHQPVVVLAFSPANTPPTV